MPLSAIMIADVPTEIKNQNNPAEQFYYFFVFKLCYYCTSNYLLNNLNPIMKKILLTFAMVSFGMILWAQQSDYIELMRSVINTEKKAAIAEVLVLSDTEADLFWPLYNEYNEKRYTVNTKKIQMIKDFAENYGQMTDEMAKEIWTRNMAIKMELVKLEKTYYKKFLKVLDAKKAVRYFQAENKIETFVNAELALEIPLLETIE